MSLPSAFPALGCFIVGMLFFGCEVPAPASPSATASGGGILLPFSGANRGLFDDGIDAEVFGAPGEGTGSADSRLKNRIRASNVVFAAQVTTVTDQSDGSTGGIELEMSPVEKPFLGSLTPFQDGSTTVRLTMRPGTIGYALLRSNQNDLIGKRLIVCLGRFDENGAAVVRWHGTEDTPRVRQSVAAAASMAELEK